MYSFVCDFTALTVELFLTSLSDMRFLLVHDVSRSHEQLKSFFSEMNEILIKVYSITEHLELAIYCHHCLLCIMAVSMTLCVYMKVYFINQL